MEIHQLLAGLHPGDAISNHALALRDLLRSWGHTSNIYARDISRTLTSECLHFSLFQPHANTIAIYHYSMDFDAVTDLFLRFPGQRMFIYHNITPHHYLQPHNAGVARACENGRARLRELNRSADVVLGDSEFNCAELSEHGFPNPRVLPIFVDFERLDTTSPCPRTLQRFQDGWHNLLFVGRLSPNKCQDDVIRAFARYNRFIARRSRLLLVGTWRGMERYRDELQTLVRQLDVQDYVVFTGHVAQEELTAYYRSADLFLCMSEHEGFCVPVLEAMHFDVPVLAYSAAAVPGTLGGSGVLATRKDYAQIAEMAHLLITDSTLHDAVVREQGKRTADFRPAFVAQQFRSYLDELVAA
jgi:glycosyltransferase involved in cell wall biosynthesis